MSTETDTAACEACGGTSYDNEDPATLQKWCKKCDAWTWFRWPKTGERIQLKTRPPRRDGFPAR
jgi:hypothetical protein